MIATGYYHLESEVDRAQIEHSHAVSLRVRTNWLRRWGSVCQVWSARTRLTWNDGAQVGSTIAGLLLGLLKFALTLGGIALAVVGLFTGNWALVVYGVISVIGGQVVHALDRRHHDKQLAEIAARAVAGIGPIPPPDVRRVLMRHALSQVGVGGNAERAFADLCQQWAAERRIGA